MSQKYMILFALAANLALAAATPANARAEPAAALPPLVTVDHVDLPRYLGRWFEIARIPNRFQKQCASNTTAEYELRNDGSITVTNTCLMNIGKADVAHGVAKIVDTSTNARLKVSFINFFGLRPFWGDYWVIGLDPDYQWAIVGTPSRRFGWVLARTPTLDDGTMEAIYGIIEKNGYQVGAFEVSPQ
jgi:apolipoprotein D and lipocalin family protein